MSMPDPDLLDLDLTPPPEPKNGCRFFQYL